MPARHHLGGVAPGDGDQVVARLRLGGEKLDADAGLGLGAVLAGAPPGHLTPDQHRAAALAETDGHHDRLADRQRPARGEEQSAMRKVSQVVVQKWLAGGEMCFEDGHVGK